MPTAVLTFATPEMQEYKSYAKAQPADVSAIKSTAKDNQGKSRYIPVSAVCAHFERHLLTVRDIMNVIAKDVDACPVNQKVPNDVVDNLYDAFDHMEDYVDFICKDFKHFSGVLKKAFPDKSKLSKRTQNRLNTVEWLFETLEEQFERQRIATIELLLSKLPDAQLSERGV